MPLAGNAAIALTTNSAGISAVLRSDVRTDAQFAASNTGKNARARTR